MSKADRFHYIARTSQAAPATCQIIEEAALIIAALEAQLAQRDAQVVALHEAHTEQEEWLHKMDAALKAADDLARKTMTRQELNSNHDYSRGWNDAVACAKKSAGAYVKARGQDA